MASTDEESVGEAEKVRAAEVSEGSSGEEDGDEKVAPSNRKARSQELKTRGQKDKTKKTKKAKGVKDCDDSIVEVARQGDKDATPATAQEEGLPRWNHDKQPEMLAATEVLYCEVCGLPPDFCEFGSSWEKCKVWIQEHCPDYYPELSSAVEDLSIEDKGGAEQKDRPRKATPKKPEKIVPQKIIVKRVNRAKQKKVTVLTGLESFGIKLDRATKVFSRAFACGASVVKGNGGIPDEIDIQGDVTDNIVDVLTINFPEISADMISIVRGK